MDLAADIASLDESTRRPVLEHLFGAGAAACLVIDADRLRGGDPLSEGLFRFSGSARSIGGVGSARLLFRGGYKVLARKFVRILDALGRSRQPPMLPGQD